MSIQERALARAGALLGAALDEEGVPSPAYVHALTAVCDLLEVVSYGADGQTQRERVREADHRLDVALQVARGGQRRYALRQAMQLVDVVEDGLTRVEVRR